MAYIKITITPIGRAGTRELLNVGWLGSLVK